MTAFVYGYDFVLGGIDGSPFDVEDVLLRMYLDHRLLHEEWFPMVGDKLRVMFPNPRDRDSIVDGPALQLSRKAWCDGFEELVVVQNYDYRALEGTSATSGITCATAWGSIRVWGGEKIEDYTGELVGKF